MYAAIGLVTLGVGAWGQFKDTNRLFGFSKSLQVYRQGTFVGNSNVKGRQWAPKNPLSTPDYPQRYGLPAENSRNPDWIAKGHIVGEYSQGPAPRSYNNPTNAGGATEIRTNNPDDVQLDWFHMPDD